ncbi:CGNR zinc finger domain-containing protein [Mycobacterium sp. 1165196.3]|uniref:CGNR zinc finger domain-containing protein n=1 Tax=Mycobacterium sp. 1165196.3 TaxID=1834071 RepID=UPI0009EE459A|nr:CGNR zinc finger domain-containing protein [Mycobacterium sp. 1165196.3]
MARSGAAELDLRGGHPAVDLVNTVAWRGDPQRRTDYLVDYLDLVDWTEHAGVVSAAEARSLAGRAVSDSDAGAKTLRQTRQLREALHCIWTGRGSARDAARVADAYRSALRVRRLTFDEDEVSWCDTALTAQTPLHRLAIESVTLLTTVPRSRVKRCGDPECGWLFLDSSHRQNRRWCSTADCGNRARVRRFYERSRHDSE